MRKLEFIGFSCLFFLPGLKLLKEQISFEGRKMFVDQLVTKTWMMALLEVTTYWCPAPCRGRTLWPRVGAGLPSPASAALLWDGGLGSASLSQAYRAEGCWLQSSSSHARVTRYLLVISSLPRGKCSCSYKRWMSCLGCFSPQWGKQSILLSKLMR